MHNKENLSKSEIQIILGLLIHGGNATTRELSETLNFPQKYVSNITASLAKKGVIISLRASEFQSGIVFGSPIFRGIFLNKPIKPKEKIHILKMNVDEILAKFPEILEWTKLALGINTAEELKKHFEKLRERLKVKK
jgi:predicted transcriptional regulator